MKKILLLLLLAVSTLCASARSLDDCQTWGLAPNDFAQLQPYGMRNTGYFGNGLKMPKNTKLKDCTFEGVRLPVGCATLQDVRVMIATDNKFTKIIASKDVPDGTLSVGFNDIAFDEPVAVPMQDVYIGYTFTVASVADEGAAEPMMVHNSKHDGGMLLCLSGAWLDYSNYGQGTCGLQVYIGSQNLEEYSVTFRGLECTNVLPGSNLLRATVRSSSQKPVASFTYSVSIGDEKQSHELVLDTPIPEGMDKTAVVDIPFEAPDNAGRFDASFSIDRVGEASNVQPDGPLTLTLNRLTRKAERRSVVEEMTGTDCGFCPRGWVGMEYLRTHYSDQFIGICIHQYNKSDAMYNAAYARLGWIGAPACMIDRSTDIIDPYNGSDNSSSIIEDFETQLRQLPEVEVSVAGQLSDDMKTVDATASLEFLGDADGYSVAYALTADGLALPAGAPASDNPHWLQENYFYSVDPSLYVMDVMPELAQFCKGGAKGQSKVLLTYNDTMISSSWNTSGTLLTEGLPKTIYAGTELSSAYTIKLPTEPMLLRALDYDDLYVVAMVIAADGHIANAGRAKVVLPTGVNSVLADKSCEPASFSLDGRRLSVPAKGISIQRSADGRSRKVMK